MVIVWGDIETDSKNLERLLALSLAHVRRSRQEPGCVRHDAHVDIENGNRVVFVEQWTNLKALQAHFAVPESARFVQAISRLALRPPRIRVFEATEVDAGVS